MVSIFERVFVFIYDIGEFFVNNVSAFLNFMSKSLPIEPFEIFGFVIDDVSVLGLVFGAGLFVYLVLLVIRAIIVVK